MTWISLSDVYLVFAIMRKGESAKGGSVTGRSRSGLNQDRSRGLFRLNLKLSSIVIQSFKQVRGRVIQCWWW